MVYLRIQKVNDHPSLSKWDLSYYTVILYSKRASSPQCSESNFSWKSHPHLIAPQYLNKIASDRRIHTGNQKKKEEKKKGENTS